MRKLGLLLIGFSVVFLGACHEHDHHDDDDHDDDGFVIPPGGADFGVMDEFDHVFDEQAISTSGDLDGFEFKLARSTLVLITGTGTGGLDMFLDLYDGNLDFIGGDDDGGPGADPVIVAQLDVGDYIVVVGSSDGSIGDYAIDISVEPLGGVDFGVLAVPDSVIDTGGDISDSFDVDSNIFTVNASCFADIFLTRTSGDYDGNLELLDEYGDVLAFVDPVSDADPDILGIALTPGTYIIRVGATFGAGEYNLQLDTF